MNKAAINIHVQVSDGCKFSTPFSKYQEHNPEQKGKNVYFYNKLSSKVSVPFCIPTSNQSSCCFLSSSACGIVSALNAAYASRCTAVSHFNLQIIVTYNDKHLFICLFVSCVSSLFLLISSMYVEMMLFTSFC